MGNHSLKDTITVNGEVRQGWSKKDVIISVISLLATISLCVVVIYYKNYLLDAKYVSAYGLLGMLVFAFLGGSVLSLLAIPVPYWLLVFTLPSILPDHLRIGAPILVGLVSGFGASLGQLLTFMIGQGGKEFSQKIAYRINKDLYDRAIAWAQRHGSLAVFVMSAIINPFHLPVTFAMASLHFPGWKFFIYSLLGNIVKSSVIAFCGYFGLTSLFHFFGV